MTNVTKKIAPSLLSANLLALQAEVSSVEDAGADWHHVDVMDGHFVPNLTFGLPVIEQLKTVARCPLDVHIMVSNPDAVAASYVKAGADRLSFHIEAATHPHRLVAEIKGLGAEAGLAINPGTPLVMLEPLLNDIDSILFMSVNPGFGGQSFIHASYARLRELRRMLDACGSRALIVVDGGVNTTTLPELCRCGVDVFVAGSAVYGARDRRAVIAALRRTIAEAMGQGPKVPAKA